MWYTFRELLNELNNPKLLQSVLIIVHLIYADLSKRANLD